MTSEEFRKANLRARLLRASVPHAVSARYDGGAGRVVVELSNGTAIAFPPDAAQALAGASPAELGTIEISPSSFGLRFAALDEDLYLPALLAGITGSERWMAGQLAALGATRRSSARGRAARGNGRKGGRPREEAA